MAKPFRGKLETLGHIKELNHSLFGHCGRPGCGRGVRLDIDGLIHRLGEDYEFVGNDTLQKSLRCDVCKWKGGSITLHGPDRS